MTIKKLTEQGNYLIYAGIALVVIAIISLIGWRVISMQQHSNKTAQQADQTNRDDPFIQQYGNNCEDLPSVDFSSAPLATDQIRYIEPMGKVSDGHVTPIDHAYISPLNPDAADNSYNVVMPANGKVVAISAMPSTYIGDRKDVTLPPEDHRVVVSFNCRYFAIFIHVHKLSDKLAASITGQTPGSDKQVEIPLMAGEPIGQIGGSPVDWTMVDMQSSLKGFITPKLYEGEPWKIHTIDPLSVYSGRLAEQLQAKSLRSTQPFGGKIDYDMPGTLQGNWFKVGTKGYSGATPDRYWDGHLAIVPDAIDPAGTIVSVGNWQGKAMQFVARGDVNPSQSTKQNSPVKYELLAMSYDTPTRAIWNGRSDGLVKGLKLSQRGQLLGTILFEVQDNEHLKVEKFPGKTSTEVTNFTAAAETYER